MPSTVLNVMSSPWETKSGWATLGPQPRAQRRTLSACSTAHDAVNTETLTGQGCGQCRAGLKVHPRLWGKRGPPVTLSKDHQLLQTELRLSMGTRGLGCDQTQGWDPSLGWRAPRTGPPGPNFIAALSRHLLGSTAPTLPRRGADAAELAVGWGGGGGGALGQESKGGQWGAGGSGAGALLPLDSVGHVEQIIQPVEAKGWSPVASGHTPSCDAGRPA